MENNTDNSNPINGILSDPLIRRNHYFDLNNVSSLLRLSVEQVEWSLCGEPVPTFYFGDTRNLMAAQVANTEFMAAIRFTSPQE